MALTDEQRAALKQKLAGAARARPGGGTTHVVTGPAGFVPLADLHADRSSFLLVGGPGAGKSTAATTFGGDDRDRPPAKYMTDPAYVRPEFGRILYLLAEHGQEGGAGGATPLKFLHEQTGVVQADVDVMKVVSWAHAETQYRWMVDNLRSLWEDRLIRVLVVDGMTEIASMVETALVNLSPTQIGAKGDGERAQVNSYVRDITGAEGRQMEKADFGRVARLVLGLGARLKLLPFRVVSTALEGDMYGDTRQGPESRPVGVGPDLPGKKIVNRVSAQADFVFHVERQVARRAGDAKGGKDVNYVFLTANEPRLPGNTNGYFAKTRGGYSLDTFVPANGRKVLRLLGFESEPLDAPLPEAPSPQEQRDAIEKAEGN